MSENGLGSREQIIAEMNRGIDPPLGFRMTQRDTGRAFVWNGVDFIPEDATPEQADAMFAEHREERTRQADRERYERYFDDAGPVGGRFQAFGLGGFQGGALDWGDEAMEAAGLRNADEAFGAAWREHPLTYAGGYLYGAARGAPGRLASWGARGIGNALPRSTPTLARWGAQGAGVGVPLGAVGGAGANREDRETGAGTGAAFGGALGALGPAVARTGQRVLAATPPTRWAARRLGMLPADDGTLGRAAVAEAMDADNAAMRAAAPAERPPGVSGTSDRALSAARANAAREFNARLGMTTGSGAGSLSGAAARRAQAAGDMPARPLDVAGLFGDSNVIQLTEDAVGRMGPARARIERQLNAQREGLPDRVGRRVDRAVGIGSAPRTERVGRAGMDRLLSGEQGQLSAQFDAAGAAPVTITDELAELASRPSAQEAMRRVMADVAEEGSAEAARFREFFFEDPATGQIFVRDGAPTEVWQRVIQTIDDVAFSTSAARATGGSTATRRGVRSMRGTRAGISNEIGAQNRPFAAANAEYSAIERGRSAARHAERILSPGSSRAGGHMDWLDEARHGSPAGTRNPVAAWYDESGQPIDDMFEVARERVRGMLIDEANRNGSALMRRIRTDRDLQARLRFIYGEEEGQALVNSLRDEGVQVGVTNRIADIVGSPTARRSGRQSSSFIDAVMADAMDGAPTRTAFNLVSNAVRRGRQLTERDFEAIADYMLSPYTPPGNRDALRQALQQLGEADLLGPFRPQVQALLMQSANATAASQ